MGTWIITWPEHEPTGQPGEDLSYQPAVTWVMDEWEPAPGEILQIESAGGIVRFVPDPEGHTRPVEKKPPTVKVDDSQRDVSQLSEAALMEKGLLASGSEYEDGYEAEMDEVDGNKEVEVSVEYEDEESNAKTVAIKYTYEHVKTSGVIGAASDSYLVIDSGGLYKMSTDGAVLEGEVVMTDELQELFDTTHIDGAGNVYDTTYVDGSYYLTKNGDLVTAILLDAPEGDLVGHPVADFDGNVFIGTYQGRLTLVSSAGDPVWEILLGLSKGSAPWFGCVGGDHCYFTDGVP